MKKGDFLKIINLEDLGTGGANAEEVYEEGPNITMSDLKNLLFISFCATRIKTLYGSPFFREVDQLLVHCN